MTVGDATMCSRPIHFRNEINKIAILNLENINVSPEAPSTGGPVYMAHARAQCTRKGLPPAPVQLGDDAVETGRPNKLMGSQLSAAAVTASTL